MNSKVFVQGAIRAIRCPACKDIHQINASWSWNGSVENPTFRPFIQVRYSFGNTLGLCHFVVTDGRISFQGDCTHNFRGQTVELPDW